MTIGMKSFVVGWGLLGSIGWGFLITSFASIPIDQNYQDFGNRICNQLPDEVSIDCFDAVKEERREGFYELVISIWVISAIAVNQLKNKKDE
jgi:hypothetical protein